MFEDRIPKELSVGDVIDGEQLRYFEGKHGRVVISDYDGRGRNLNFEVTDAREVFHVKQDDRMSISIPVPSKIRFFEVKRIKE